MRTLSIVFLAASSLLAQTAKFPGSIATDAQLTVARNQVATRLVGGASASDTVLSVRSATSILPNMLLSVEAEIVEVTAVSGNTLTVIRGFDSTTPAVHQPNAAVQGFLTAWHHNAVTAEIKAIETSLWGSAQSVAAYAFSLTSGAGVSASLASPGAAVFTFANCPAGVTGADANHYLYISGGTGTAESVLILGGTCTAGLVNGTLIVTTAYAHTGAWSIGSATAGIAEALSVSSSITLAPATYTVHAPTYTRAADKVIGSGRLATNVAVAADFPLTAAGVFVQDDTTANNGYLTSSQFSDFSITFIQPDSLNVATYTAWPAAFKLNRVFKPYFSNLTISLAWDGFVVTNSSGLTLQNIQMSAYHRGVDIDTTYDTVRIDNLHFWPFGPAITQNQIDAFVNNTVSTGLYIGHVDSLDVQGSVFLNALPVNLHTGSDSGSTFGTFSGDYFDSVGQFTMSAGIISMANCWWSTGFGTAGFSGGTTANYAIKQTGGRLTIGSSNILANPATVTPIQITFSGNSTTAGLTYVPSFTLTGTNIFQGVADVSAIVATSASAGAGEVALMGNSFFRGGSIAYAQPVISIVNTIGSLRSRIIGNVISDKGTGAGTFISIAADDQVQVWGNNSVGWTNSFPATKAIGTYQDVNSVSFPASLNMLAISPAIRTVTATGGIFSNDYTVLCDATGGAVSLGLPQASTVGKQLIVVKKIDASVNACTVVGFSGETIDNASSVVISTRYATASIQSDGTKWWKWAN